MTREIVVDYLLGTGRLDRLVATLVRLDTVRHRQKQNIQELTGKASAGFSTINYFNRNMAGWIHGSAGWI